MFSCGILSDGEDRDEIPRYKYVRDDTKKCVKNEGIYSLIFI